MYDRSKKAYQQALKVIPGGVDSPARSLRAVFGHPIFMQKAKGQYIYDIDGNRYRDFCLSWGVHILGHNHPAVIRAVQLAIKNGTSFGAATELETKLAEMIVGAVPSIEKVRFVNSGTEAAMSAIRLARAFTNRDVIVKFDGCYHGHCDQLLVSAGVPAEAMKYTFSVPFNDQLAIDKLFKRHGKKIAAVIVEPVPANMGVVSPHAGFLEQLRILTDKYDSLLIFDEVITGFRIGLGGAQGDFGIRPDLTILGKIIGGGFPVGAFGGRKEIMDRLAPAGDVYQAGTLSGNPVAMSAGIAVLKELQQPGFYEKLNKKADRFIVGLKESLWREEFRVNSYGSMFTVFFSKGPVNNYLDAKNSDVRLFKKFYSGLLEQGSYFSPSPYEANFLCQGLK